MYIFFELNLDAFKNIHNRGNSLYIFLSDRLLNVFQKLYATVKQI